MAAARRWGFRLTSGSAPAAHGRVHLDRCYLELKPGPRLTVAGLFFKGQAIGGLALESPIEYRGIDGVWMDAPLRMPNPRRLTLAFTERISPARKAADWPPALAQKHPNGIVSIESVHLTGEVTPLEPLADDAGLVLSKGGGPPRIVAVRFASATGPLQLSLDGPESDELPGLRPS